MRASRLPVSSALAFAEGLLVTRVSARRAYDRQSRQFGDQEIDPETGLAAEQAKIRSTQYGLNELAERRHVLGRLGQLRLHDDVQQLGRLDVAVVRIAEQTANRAECLGFV